MTEEPPIRVMGLHALGYCERLFYLEEVEEIRLADEAVYAGRRLHESLKLDEGDWRTLELSSERLGLVGKVDTLRDRNGTIIPYEHKRGRSRAGQQGPEAWPSDRLQALAYALMVEEALLVRVDQVRVRYHGDNRLVTITVDEAAREEVSAAVRRARELRQAGVRPPIAQNDRACLRCAMAPVCLPEEERLATDPDWVPARLFPERDDRKTLHVTRGGFRVVRSAETLCVEPPKDKQSEEDDFRPQTYPIREIGSVVLHGYAQITTQALHLCMDREIQVHWLSPAGRYVAGVAPGAGTVQRRLRQYHALSQPGFCLQLTRRLASAKLEGQLRYLLRASRKLDRDNGTEQAIREIRLSLSKISQAESVDTVRGHEGTGARAYFSALGQVLKPGLPATLTPTGRNRRPPRDCFNALLSFGYGLLYQAVLSAILCVGLEPALGFFHTPRSAAHPLVLDLMELFRVPIWDIPVVGSLNRGQWEPSRDFQITDSRVWLSASGRRQAIQLFEQRLQDAWRHPVLNYSLSYERHLELEVRLLEKEWTSQPGLFARTRLR